jgi:hypothetical protein
MFGSGTGIRDEKIFGSGIEYPGSATLHPSRIFLRLNENFSCRCIDMFIPVPVVSLSRMGYCTCKVIIKYTNRQCLDIWLYSWYEPGG